jgi:glycerate dehydrogenase
LHPVYPTGLLSLAHSSFHIPHSAFRIPIVPLEELLRTADVVSLHCPLTPETDKLINAERLKLIKPTAFLINTSRGGLIDEPALAEALNSGRLAGAGLDVLSVEPPPPDNPLLNAKNCCITPHIAWASKGARQRLMDEVVENLRAFLAGTPRNVVNA